MTDYTQYPYIEKRVRYFDGQFLKDQDFIDEQKYYIDRQRRLNKFLRVSGVCDGLTLETATDHVTVKPGTALDSQGRQIVLSINSTISLSSHRNDEVYLIISYQKEESDQATDGGLGSGGSRRWHEKPNIQVATPANLPEDSIVLAKLTIDGNGTVTPNLSERKYSGVRLPSGNSDSGAITGPTLRSGGNSASSLAVIDGDLKVTGDTTLNGNLSLNSNLSVSGNIQGGTDDRLNIYTNTGVNNSPAWIELWGNDSSRSGELALTGTYIDFRYNSTTSSSGSVGMRLTSDGNVGIGTTDPGSSKLKVQGNLTVTGDTNLSSLSIGNSITFIGSATLSFGSQNRQMINLYDQDYAIGIQHATQYFRSNKNFAWYKSGSHNDGELNAGTGGTVQMVIKNGNVGIGTSDPGSSKLKVQGNLTVTGDTNLSSLSISNGSTFTGSSTLSFGSQVRQMINLWNQTYGIGIQSNTQYFRTDNNFAWYKGGSHNDGELSAGTGGTVQMVIKNGNVGIGTTDPGSSKLKVQGTLTVTGNATLNGMLNLTRNNVTQKSAQIGQVSIWRGGHYDFQHVALDANTWEEASGSKESFHFGKRFFSINAGQLWFTNLSTSGSGSWLRISSGGRVYRDSSSIKYKQNIDSFEMTNEEIVDYLAPRLVSFMHKDAVKDGLQDLCIGVIAEEFFRSGTAKQFVQHDLSIIDPHTKQKVDDPHAQRTEENVENVDLAAFTHVNRYLIGKLWTQSLDLQQKFTQLQTRLESLEEQKSI
ncbi:MAG: hypothetical protein F6K58_14800 [Symploca sp. SIO2E9]|nr:hypothetical protein [Symploca sp. SIO2E9]